MENELVSIVMPMYNTLEKQLREAIESIINQTYINFELIIVDDCSNNGCDKVVEEYIKKDSRIKMLRNSKNCGIEITLNKGIKKAQSNYIVRMDSDDIAYKDRIEIQINFMKKNPQYSFIGGRADFFDESGIFRETTNYGEITKTDMLLGTPFIHPTMIIKKEALKSIGFYPSSYRTEDYLMQMLLIANGYKGYIIREKVLKYRQDRENITRLTKRQRISEVKAKWIGFRKMKVKKYNYIFLIKPLIAMCIPLKIMQIYQKKKK